MYFVSGSFSTLYIYLMTNVSCHSLSIQCQVKTTSYETICLSCLYLIIFYRQVVDVPVHWNSQSFWIIKYPRQLTFVDSGTVWRGGRLGRVNGGGVRFPQLSHWPGTQPRNGAVLADPRLHPVCACQSDSGFKSRTCTSYWWSRDCYVTRFAYIWRTCS